MGARVRVLTLLVVVAAAGIVWAQGPAARPLAHRFQKIADGVYAAMPNGIVNVVSNSAVIVNADDVVVVDSHATPASARALVEDIRTITPKPMRYVINTDDASTGWSAEVRVLLHPATYGDPILIRLAADDSRLRQAPQEELTRRTAGLVQPDCA